MSGGLGFCGIPENLIATLRDSGAERFRLVELATDVTLDGVKVATQAEGILE